MATQVHQEIKCCWHTHSMRVHQLPALKAWWRLDRSSNSSTPWMNGLLWQLAGDAQDPSVVAGADGQTPLACTGSGACRSRDGSSTRGQRHGRVWPLPNQGRHVYSSSLRWETHEQPREQDQNPSAPPSCPLLVSRYYRGTRCSVLLIFSSTQRELLGKLLRDTNSTRWAPEIFTLLKIQAGECQDVFQHLHFTIAKLHLV